MAQVKAVRSVEQNREQQVEILYQKLGQRWFAFSVINDEIFVGSLTDDEIQIQGANLASDTQPAARMN